MKFTCSRKDISDALALVGHAVSSRAALPVLQSIRVEAEGSQVILLACDGEMWVERRVAANVSEPGAVCVNGKSISDLVSQLGGDSVGLETDSTSLFVRQDGSDWRFNALPAEEFPLTPPVDPMSKLDLPMGKLREAIAGVSYAVADDGGRPVLSGMMFHYDGQVLVLVATDTHRLAVHRVAQEGMGSSINAVVPAKALRTIRDLPLSDEESVSIVFSDQRLMVDTGGATVVSQLLQGTFPAWERVVPTEFTRTWVFQRDEMTSVVKRALLLARDSANRVRFQGLGDQITLSARSEERGEAKEEVAAVNKNGDVEIAFNARYVLDALNAMKSDGIRAELTEPSRPAVFRPVAGSDDQFCVIMPMALP